MDIGQLGITFRGMAVNRMTGNLWRRLLPFFPLRMVDGPPDGEQMDLDALGRALTTKLQMARLRGGVWILPPGLWLIENEVDGWTVMLPEDY